MLELATTVPDPDDSAIAAPPFAKAVTKLLILDSKTSLTLMVIDSWTELVPSLAVSVIVYEVAVS